MAERYNERNQGLGQVKPRSAPAAGELYRSYQRILPIFLIGWAIALWLVSLPFVKPREMTDVGLLSVLPFPYYFGLIILTFSFCYVVFRQPDRGWLLNLHVLAFILMIHATPTLVYGTLRYSWSWKHVGITDYIVRNGSVNPTIDFLSAYHNWPGFFVLNSLIVEASGVESALIYAPAATLFFNLLFFGALTMIFRALTADRRLIWLSMWFFFLADWIGQDYFAPQSFAYFFYLVIIGILLRWFAMRSANAHQTQPTPVSGYRTRLIDRLRGRLTYIVPGPAASPAQRVILISLVVLLMAVITSSHQLTPLMLIIALAFLVLAGVVYPRGLPLLMLVMTAAWIFFVAGPFSINELENQITTFGHVTQNVSANLINLRTASTGQVVIALMGRGLTMLMIVLGIAGFIVRLIKGHFDLAAMLLALVPFPMLAASSYGGEILFRIYFFALPFLAFFTASLFVPDREAGRSLLAPIGAGLLSLAIITAFLFAYYGKEKQYYMTPEEIQAANFMYDNALPGSLIVEGTRNYPSLFRNYEKFTYVPISREPAEQVQAMVSDPVNELNRWMENRRYPAAYVLITRSMKAEIDMVGDMPPRSLDEIEQKLKGSGKFQVLYQNQDAIIFVLKEREHE